MHHQSLNRDENIISIFKVIISGNLFILQTIHCIIVGDNMDNPDITDFKEELKGGGLNDEEIFQCIEIVKDIHIGQNIRRDVGGIIYQDIIHKFGLNPIKLLLKYNYIEKFQWNRYRFRLFCTTEKGSKIGKIAVTNLIEKNKDNLERFLSEQPQKVLNFIIRKHYLEKGDEKFIYPVDTRGIEVINWKDRLRKSNKIHRAWITVLSELEVVGLCIRTPYYVSTSGGELREENYVIPPEVFAFLMEHCPKESLTDEEYEKIELYDFLSDFTRKSDLPPDVFGDVYWNKLMKVTLDQEKVKEAVDKMTDFGITSEYLGSDSLEAPFSIKDKIRYVDWLEKNLLEPVIESSLEPSKIGETEEKKDKPDGKDINKGKAVVKQISTSPPSDLKILLGKEGNNKEIFWEPKKEINWSFVIVGSAGTGKTQTVKAILSEFAKFKLPYIIFDFRNDYVSKAKESDFGQILDLDTISINPLELDGDNTPKDQKYQISDIVDLVYNIGERQVGYIRSAIKASYEDEGINEEDKDSWNNVPPTFDDIQNSLNRISGEGDSGTRSSIEGIFARLDPIFDYGIFSAKTVMPFEKIMNGQTVVNLGILPNEKLKAVVCEFFMRKLRYYLDKIGESREPRLYVIIDEAHRLKYEREASAGQLLKEARKYGVGMLLSTQDPVDFTDVVYNNIGGIMSLQLIDPKYAKSIAEHLGGKVTWRNVKNDLSSKFSGYVKFSSNENAIRFDVVPHYER